VTVALLIDLSAADRILLRFPHRRLRAATEALMASSARIDELRKKFDENPRRYFAPLANEFRKAGEVDQAIMICEEFLPQQPGHMSGHIVYGQALYEAGRLDESRTVFETALTLDPENLIALRHLGDITRGQGDVDGARGWYRRVLEADPRNDEIQALITSLDEGGAVAPLDSAPQEPVDEPALELSHSAEPPVAAEREPEPRFAPPPPLDLDLEAAVGSLTASRTAAVPHGIPDAPIETLSLAGLVDAPHAGATPASAPEGLESAEFTPPTTPLAPAMGLQGSLDTDVGEFSAPTSAIPPLPGLEDSYLAETEGRSPAAPEPAAEPQREPATDSEASGAPLPFIDLDEGLDDDIGESPELPMLDVNAPAPARVAAQPTAPAAAAPTLDDFDLGELGELPPSVIAAEAELIDERSDAASASNAAAPATPFVTETMAELYLSQGFRDQALGVYRQLLEASPSDERLQRRVAELQPAPVADAGPNVREFFARIAARRPGAGAAADLSATPPGDDDFAALDSPPVDVAASTEHPPAASSRAAAPPQAAGGSIDALFGNRAVGTSEDSAASALAQAFGPGAEPAAMSGRPARAAAGELSLDSVFRDSSSRPPRPSQSFSFDEFFSESAGGGSSRPTPGAPAPTVPPDTAAAPPGEPAERSADDVQRFNSWLQGLKQR
jgi:tetratricopeptide (TPR) repeat protein